MDACPGSAEAKVKSIGGKDVTVVPSNLIGRLCIPKDFNMVKLIKGMFSASG